MTNFRNKLSLSVSLLLPLSITPSAQEVALVAPVQKTSAWQNVKNNLYNQAHCLFICTEGHSQTNRRIAKFIVGLLSGAKIPLAVVGYASSRLGIIQRIVASTIKSIHNFNRTGSTKLEMAASKGEAENIISCSICKIINTGCDGIKCSCHGITEWFQVLDNTLVGSKAQRFFEGILKKNVGLGGALFTSYSFTDTDFMAPIHYLCRNPLSLDQKKDAVCYWAGEAAGRLAVSHIIPYFSRSLR